MDYLVSVALFAITTSVTPGPNNILVMTSGLNYGVKKSLPLLTGICVGFAVMLLLLGFGFGFVFNQFPYISFLIKIVGAAYLVYLSYLIANSSFIGSSDENAKPMGFLKGALFQWVNAKAWVVALGAVTAFTNIEEPRSIYSITIAVTFLFVSFPCVGIWLGFGTILRKKLKTSRYLKRFNLTMASLLLLSVLPVIRNVLEQVSYLV